VPRSVDTVGWYRYGPGLDTPSGAVVIAGHVDSATQGAGAFFRLRDVEAGAEVRLAGPDGSTRLYTVTAREVFAKSQAPLERVFAREGSPRLILITCGGEFDSDIRRYSDNIVITAVPQGS
jgi:sortase (surface protein transpeptidase)